MCVKMKLGVRLLTEVDVELHIKNIYDVNYVV